MTYAASIPTTVSRAIEVGEGCGGVRHGPSAVEARVIRCQAKYVFRYAHTRAIEQFSALALYRRLRRGARCKDAGKQGVPHEPGELHRYE